MIKDDDEDSGEGGDECGDHHSILMIINISFG